MAQQTSLKTRMLEAFRFRMYFFLTLTALMFSVLLLQVINLQLLQGREYGIKSRMNMENYIPIPASRGEIYDRNFKPGEKNAVLVSNRPSFNVTMIPAKFKSVQERNRVIDDLALLLGLNAEDIRNEIKNGNPWERFVIKEDVDFNVIVTIASREDKYPNVDWEDAPVRVYNFSNMFAHAVGYIGNISKEEYKTLKGKGYKHYQKIGKAGLEKQYDTLIRGTDGFVRRIVDVRKRTEGEEVGQHPLAGNNMVLTIDYEVQKAAYDSIGELNGAVIAIKPATGEVIALLSKPDYDPNAIISKNNDKIIRDLYQDQSKPFLNRVIQSKYPPASTFKLITAMAGLETEKTYPSLAFYCPGKYTLQGYVDHDFYDYDTHGTVDLYWAIAKSCSVYFYRLGYKIGPTVIMSYAEHFGLNSITGIDLPGEIPGDIPSKKWKLKTFGQPWFDGDTLNLAIGQGFTNVTVAEMANFMCTMVNNGIVFKPHLVREILSPDNRRVVQHMNRKKLREIPLSPLSLNIVKQGMRLGVTSGTSGRLSALKVPAAGKTGTAQTRSKRLEKFSQHAWFVGYAPYEDLPEKAVVIVVFVEYGIAGAASAVPVAERMFSKMYDLGYFK